ncbi:MAG: acetyl-CoA C-acetyltransferase [Proteobacteria bacterium]|nr:acetyl-CoA C-acetyltransferase [Pseudomonadota bacterium]
MSEALIIDACRTPRGRGKAEVGALSGVHPQELLAQVLGALVERNGFEPEDVEDVVCGVVRQAEEQGACLGRNAVLAAGWPDQPTGVSLNRFCGSGLQAVNFAAMGVASGMQELVVGGGVESMSRVLSDKAGLDGRNAHLRELHPIVPQGISADVIATLEGFSRQDLDAYAVSSQERTAVAQKEGRFERSLIPVVDLEGSVLLEADEHPRPGSTLEGMAKLPPSFADLGAQLPRGEPRSHDQNILARYPQIDSVEHLHHAGNSSGIVDGAGAVLIASEDYARDHGLRPRARIRMTATAGEEPLIMLTGPTPATRRCLDKAGMTLEEIDLFEINEAFAAIPLKTIRDLDLDPDKVNVNGGAIALGHPLGATGAMLVGTLLDELERRDLSTGLVTMCIGGGMGIATILERV